MSVLNIPLNDFSDINNAIMPFNVLADNYGSDLAVKQLQLEHEAHTEGEKRFLKVLQRQVDNKELADNAAAKPLLGILIPKVAQAVSEWSVSKPRREPIARPFIAAMDAEVCATITIKVILGELAREEEANLQKIAGAIGMSLEDEQRYGRIRDEEQKHFKKHVQEALNKRAGVVYKKAFMQAVEAKMLDAKQLTSAWESWTPDEKMHVGIKMLEIVMGSTGLIALRRMYAGDIKKDQQVISLAPEFVEVLTQRAHALAGISPMYQPCVVPPRPWSDIRGGGYWAAGRRPLNLIRTGSRKALERYLDVSMPQVYNAVNRIQDTAWRINKKVLNVINEITRWKECPVESVPSLNKGELPEKPDDINHNAIALKLWKKSAAVVYRKEKTRQSRRLSMEYMVSQANKFSQFKAIWFPYNMDWRGRVYAVSMFNPQGDDMTKGVLTLAKGKPIGEEGFYWLKIHGANTAGIDKVDFPERLKWVEENHDRILETAKNPLDMTDFWSDLDSPFCFLAFCFEYAGVVNHGLGFVSSLPVAFDGSCSGIQHFSAMLRDEVGGEAVNLTLNPIRQDIYQIVADKVNERIKHDLISGTADVMVVKVDKKTGEITERLKLGTKVLSGQWSEFTVGRGVTKRSVMTLPYGSVEYGFRDQILEDTIQPAIDNGKGNMFVSPNEAAGYMAKLIWQEVGKTVIAAVQAMKWLKSAARLMAATLKDEDGLIIKEALPMFWVTPDGFPVWQEYRQSVQRRLDLMFLGRIRLQPTINTKKDSGLDPKKQESGMAPNFVHSQDGSHLRMTVNQAYESYGIESFAVIHDSFGTIPADAGKLFKAVRETMVKTYTENDVIADLHVQFAEQLHESQIKKMPAIPAKGKLVIKDILESKFSFA